MQSGFVASLSDFFAVGTFIKAAKVMHDKLLHAVLRSKTQFFEYTPMGRIINRQLNFSYWFCVYMN
jgi:hypothetical protein